MSTRNVDAPTAEARATTPPRLQRALSGDLEAIVGKALEKVPERRYDSAEAFAADLGRFLRLEPLTARTGGWAYVSRRAIQRHRVVAVAAAIVFLSMAVGGGVAAWQARLAREEAANATAVKNFLLQVFRASDPRLASDQPRGQLTARQLLDAGSNGIESNFREQPGLQIELLGVVASLYRELGETDRYRDLVRRRTRLAQRTPGLYPRAQIEALLDEAEDDLEVPKRDDAPQILARVDALLRQASLDQSTLRARWWVGRSRAEAPPDLDAQARDLGRALALFERVAPHDAGRIRALASLAEVDFNAGRYEAAIERWHTAIAAAPQATEPMEGELLTLWGNIGTADFVLGRNEDAGRAYEEAILITARTYGTSHPEYWRLASAYAELLHLSGQREVAMRRFEELRTLVPDPPQDDAGWNVLINYAGRLTAQGEPERGVAWMEAALNFELARPTAPFALRRLRLNLGNMYSLLGRREEARRAIRSSYEEYTRLEPVDSPARMGTSERWARILLEDGQADEARRLFEEVVNADHGRKLVYTALARAGLARSVSAGSRQMRGPRSGATMTCAPAP